MNSCDVNGYKDLSQRIKDKLGLEKSSVATLGCSGSRKFADIKPDEVIVGMNGENIGCVVNSLEAL